MAQEKRGLTNILLILLMISVVVVGIVVIKAIDYSRFKTEALVFSLEKLEKKLNHVEESLKNSGNQKFDNLQERITHSKAANSQYFDGNADFGGRIINCVTAGTENLNNILSSEKVVSDIWTYTSSSLATRDYENPDLFEGLMAEKWEISDDKLLYDITIKSGVLWHDFKDPVSGKQWKDIEVTAEDFKFYVDVIKDEKVDCAPPRVYFQDLDRVEVISKYRFKVYWKKKYFLSESWTLGLMPLPRHFYKDYEGAFDGKKFNDDYVRNKFIVGCGPYRFDRWDSGQRIVLKRWDKYFGAKYGISPPLDSVAIEIINHPNTQFQALLSDDIDRMNLTPDQWVNKTNIPEFDSSSPAFKIRKLKFPSRAYSYIGYNQKNPLFQDKKVRQALTYLVDREKILKVAYNGLGRIVSGPFFIDSPYYNKAVKPYEFSPEKAKALLKEAGWEDHDGDGILDKDGKKFEFNALSVTTSTIQEKMFPIIDEDMKKAGISMNINKVEWSVFVQRLDQKKFDVVSLAWALPLDPDPTQIFHSSGADIESSSNHISFKNKEVDELLGKLRECFDQKERIRICHEIHRILSDEQPYTFLFCPEELVGINTRYENVRLFPEYPVVPEDIMWIPKDKQLSLKN